MRKITAMVFALLIGTHSYALPEIEDCFRGVFTDMRAIGGETTGFGFRVEGSNKLLEIDLRSNSFERHFVAGRSAKICGLKSFRQGIERGRYAVVVVTKIETAIQPQTEKLKGFRANSIGVEFVVHSSGCTDKSSFKITVKGARPKIVTLVRIKPDDCEAYVPYGMSVKYGYSELGLTGETNFQIGNALDVIALPSST